MPNPLNEILAKGGELDPALKRSRLEALYGPGYTQYITPEGNFEIPVGAVAPQAQGPLASPQGPAPFKRGGLAVAMDLLNAGGMLSSAIGQEDWANALYEKAQDYQHRIDAIPRRVARIEDAGSMKDVAVYAYETLAENVPMIATLFLPGGVASIGARGIGLSARAARVAGWTASYATDVGLQTGESVEIARRAGQDPNDIRVIGTGLGKAALDFIPFFALAGRLGIGPAVQKNLISDLVQKGFLKRAAGNIGTLIATEVPTEVMQESINIALDRSLSQREGNITDEEVSQLKNAAAGAVAVSLGLGAAGGVMRPRQATQEELSSGAAAAIPTAELPSTGVREQPVTQLDTGVITTSGEFVPATEFNPFSYSEVFDEKTGEMSITGKEYQKALIQQGREITYDPTLDTLTGTDARPSLSIKRTGWQFDPNVGFVYDGGKATVQMSDAGFEAQLANGATLGGFPTPEQAMRQAEKFAYDSEPISGVDVNGEYKYEQQDASKRLAIALQQQAQLTPTESALIAIENAKPEARVDPYEIPRDEQVLIAQLDPGMQKLLEARMEFLGNKDHYRTTDSQMKNAAVNALERIDGRIEALARRLGIPNPLKPDSGVQGRTETEEVFAERAKEADKPKYPNLSATEASLLDALEEKEREPGRGLTMKEYEQLERLIAKRSLDIGVPENERVRLTDQEVEQLLKDAKKRYAKEYKIVKRKPSDKVMAAKVTNFPIMEDWTNGIGALEGDPDWVVSRGNDILGEIRTASNMLQNYEAGTYEIDTAILKELETKGGVVARLEQPGMVTFLGTDPTVQKSAWFPDENAAKDWIIDQHMLRRKDWKRLPAARNVSGELEQSRLSPARKKLEIEMIKAVRKIYDGLVIKPRVDFAHSWNTDLFPEGTSLQQAVQRYRGFIQFKDAGRVYLILNNLHSVAEAERTFVHEVLAHYGLRAFFKPKELEQILRTVAKERGDEVFAHRNANAELAGEPTPVGVLTLDQAEEFIASKFEEFYRNGADSAERGFVQKLLALFRRFLRHVGLSSWSDKDLADVMRDIGKGLRQGVIRNNTSGYWWSHQQASEPLAAVIGRDAARVVDRDINTLGEVWRAKAGLGILTPLQVAERFNVDGAKAYIETTMQWWGRKRTLTNGATELAETWQKMPKKHAERLADAIFAATEASDKLKRRLSEEELGKIFKEKNVTADGIELYRKMDSEFKAVLGNLEAGLKRAVLRQHARSSAEAEELYQLWQQPSKDAFLSKSKEFMGNLELGARLSDIESQINTLRDRNYFPYMRFGQYALTVRAKRELSWQGEVYRGPTDDKRGEVVHFETFENAKAQQDRFESLRKEFPEHLFSLKGSVVSEEEFSFLGMPPALLDMIREHVKMTDQQAEDLKELFYLRSPGRAFLRHLVKRRGTAGYSQDALRVFASYMMNAANHIARIEYNPDLTDHLTTMRKFAQENGNVAGLVANYFTKHHTYLMNPENDLAQLRALGFLWYLGFNVKSALVNLTQVPMVAFPYLGSVYGETKAIGALSNAYKRVVDWRRGKAVLSKEMESFVQRGIAEGFLDESRATELAGLAEGGTLHRILPIDKSARLLNQTAYYGSYLFRHAEKFNREVVFLASLELSKSRGLNGEEAFRAARKAVQTTMFEYAKWNRPEFMRGKKSVFFLFWNYMQHLTYLAFGGEGTKTALRVNLMLLMAAGLQGLPFAENILDLIDWSSTEVREVMGSKDPRVDLRQDIRELALSLTDRPDLAMHGLSRYYGLAAFHALELLGVPVPQVDVSGSLSAGEPIPGIRELVEPSRDPDKKLGGAIVSALGPVAGIGYTFWKSLMSQDPDQWKTWERAMPTAMRVASQAIRRGDRGEESFRGGGAIAKFDPLNTEHRTELIANALGFAPTRMSQAYELRSAQEDLRQYWTVRRAMVLENYAWALLGEDVEARADARQAIERFNRDAPSPKLRLSGEEIARSLRQRTRLRSLREQGLPNEKAFQPLYRQMAPAYGAGAPGPQN